MMGLIPQLEDVAIALTIFIFFFTIPSIRSLAKGTWRAKKDPLDQALFEDEDGAASAETADQFSNKVQFLLIFLIALIGLGLSIADTVFTIIDSNSSTASSSPRHIGIYLLFPTWVRTEIIQKKARIDVDYLHAASSDIAAHRYRSPPSATYTIQERSIQIDIMFPPCWDHLDISPGRCSSRHHHLNESPNGFNHRTDGNNIFHQTTSNCVPSRRKDC
jgi:hypothetical protein